MNFTSSPVKGELINLNDFINFFFIFPPFFYKICYVGQQQQRIVVLRIKEKVEHLAIDKIYIINELRSSGWPLSDKYMEGDGVIHV